MNCECVLRRLGVGWPLRIGSRGRPKPPDSVTNNLHPWLAKLSPALPVFRTPRSPPVGSGDASGRISPTLRNADTLNGCAPLAPAESAVDFQFSNTFWRQK
jgi:hypothetical protein